MKQEKTIKVGGMSCVRCSAAVEHALTSLDGVGFADVSYANGKAYVEYDDSVIDLKTIEKAIKKAGYEVIEDVRQARKREFKRSLVMFVFSAVLSLPFFLMMLLMFVAPDSALMHYLHNGVLQLVLATPIQFVAGFRFYRAAFHSLRNKAPGMDLLVAMGTTSAYVYSVYNLISGATLFYFESSAMVITLVLLGKMLESRAKAKTGEAIERLMDLTPKNATILQDGVEVTVSVSRIKVGDTVIVHPGESVPVDGVLADGESYIDESMLTGESAPVSKTVGDKVFAGTLNGKGSFAFTVSGISDETVLSGIIRMVEQAQSSKAHIRTLVDKVSAIFVPTVALVAIVTFVATFFASDSVGEALDRAVAVLVVACPCSLGLATPTALMVGIGRGASMGILIKNADALERACRIDAVMLDKTGTVTEGRPHIVSSVVLDTSLDEPLKYAASAESRSEHPLGEVIASAYEGKTAQCEDFTAVTGCGVSAVVEGKRVLVGKPSWIEEECGIALPESVYALASEGNTVSVAAVSGTPALAIAISDRLRDDSEDALKGLKSLGIHTVLVTGDNQSSAKKVSSSLAIDEVYPNLLPEGKVDVLNRLKQSYTTVAMVGDGINDAPVLTASDVGFAVGNGTDIAMESGDIVLTGGGISAVRDAILLSKATMRKIKQNLFWAFFYNTVGIPLAAFGLLSPVVAGAAMAFSSVSVVTNSLLLKRVQLK